MVRVAFTKNLERHVSVASIEVEPGSLAEVLERTFAKLPAVRGYVVDEQGAVRHHMVIFVDGEQVADRGDLSGAVTSGSEVYIMQALSGG